MEAEVDEVIEKSNATMEWLCATVERLVDDPKQVLVKTFVADALTMFEVYVAPEDVGKLIGKHGRTARALRTLLGCSSQLDEVRYAINIVERRDAPAK